MPRERALTVLSATESKYRSLSLKEYDHRIEEWDRKLQLENTLHTHVKSWLDAPVNIGHQHTKPLYEEFKKNQDVVHDQELNRIRREIAAVEKQRLEMIRQHPDLSSIDHLPDIRRKKAQYEALKQRCHQVLQETQQLEDQLDASAQRSSRLSREKALLGGAGREAEIDSSVYVRELDF